MKRILLGLLLIITMVGISACASSAGPENSSSDESVRYDQAIIAQGSPPAPMAPPAPSPMPTITIPGIKTSPSMAEERPETIPASPVYASEGGGESEIIERMIVRTGNLALVVDDVSYTVKEITRLTETYEGYVVSSNSWKEGERLVGNITVRVPAGRFADAMRVFRDLAVEVNSDSTSSRDVTEEYVDLSAKLANLEASEARLVELLQKAENVEDLLDIEREITRTRGEIEQTKGRMQYLERTSDTSLIEIYLQQAKLEVNFSARNSTVKTGEEVRFYGEIAGGFTPYSYEWDFGDGNTSTDSTPRHKYQSKGTYTVTFKVTDDRGNTDMETRSAYITVLPGWDAGNIASGAWNGLVTFGRVMANIFIWIGIFSPVWIIIGGGLFWWMRRRKKASKA